MSLQFESVKFKKYERRGKRTFKRTDDEVRYTEKSGIEKITELYDYYRLNTI